MIQKNRQGFSHARMSKNYGRLEIKFAERYAMYNIRFNTHENKVQIIKPYNYHD